MQEPMRSRRWVLRATGAAIAIPAIGFSASAAEHIITYEAIMTDEAHGLDTGASGHACFDVNTETGEVEYIVHIDRICDPNQVHIHLGGPDEDGPVVVWLYPEDVQEPRTIEGLFQGTLAHGTFTADDFVGPFEGLSLEEAHAMADEEGIYVNVHTDRHPGGEIRGQIEPVDRVEVDEEVMPDEPDPEPVSTAADADLRLGALNVGPGVEIQDEYITIQNVGDTTVNFSGWTLQDRRGEGRINGTRSDPWVFPEGIVLDPGEAVQIFSGEGVTVRTVWYIGFNNHIWRQTGDTVIVEDADGNVALEEEYDDQT